MTTNAPPPVKFDYIRERLDDQIKWYGSKSNEAKTQYFRLQLVALVCSSTIPVIMVFAPDPWVPAVLGGAAALAAGLAALFAWQSLWIRYRGTGEALIQERVMHTMRVGEYSGPDADRILVERCEQILAQEREVWTRALEQIHPNDLAEQVYEEAKAAADVGRAWDEIRSRARTMEVSEPEDLADAESADIPGAEDEVVSPSEIEEKEEPTAPAPAPEPVATIDIDLPANDDTGPSRSVGPAPSGIVAASTTLPPLHLGCVDGDQKPDWREYFGRFHRPDFTTKHFRGEPNDKYYRRKTVDDGVVMQLQQMLRSAGFLPYGPIDGIYGYRTLSAVRLFQEYMLTIARRPEVGGIDGYAGKKTLGLLQGMLDAGMTAEWAGYQNQPTPAYEKAMEGLEKIRDKLSESKAIDLRRLNEGAAASDSIAVPDWTFDPRDVHWIGIRTKPNAVKANRRANDDVFVLLVNGMKWVFRGSTDPNPAMTKRKDLPFLLRGQHRYRNGWHKRSNQKKRYQAFRPAEKGVLVVRSAFDPFITAASYDRVAQPNTTINLHWSGIGASNWSAGCQVVAAEAYLNYRGELMDLTGRSAPSYTGLSGSKTRGAYNALLDLAIVFQRELSTKSHIYYTLLNEEDVELVNGDVDFSAKV